MKYKPYMGKILSIDLSTESYEIIETPKNILEEYIGGKGLGVKLYQKYIEPDTKPLSPDNVIFYLTGPLTGTLAPAFRSCLVTRSPLTNTWLDSYFGGHFGQEIKYAGYDALIIKGKAERLTYITIDDNEIKFHNADQLKNIKVSETTKRLKDKHGDNFRISCIGPAGENLVRYAMVTCEPKRQAGRGGAGAVMGSKNLKAVAVKGSNLIEVANNDKFLQAVNKAYQELKDSDSIRSLTQEGTPSSIPFANNIGMLPNQNYKYGQFKGSEQLESNEQRNTFWQRNIACSGCPIACGKIGKVFTGKFEGLVLDTVEYETLGLIGANLGISDINYIIKIANLCDELGLDTISTGGALGFAIEAANRSNKQFLNNDQLEFNNPKYMVKMIEDIAKRKNKLGDLLAEGVKRASQEIPGSKEYSVHIKGLETPAWPPRGSPGMGLALMTADRGGCHQRGFPVSYEAGSTQFKGENLNRLSLDKKAELVVHLQNKLAALDTLIKCDFGTFGISEDTYRAMLSAAIERDLPEDYWQKLGTKVWDQTRQINVKHGFERKDDYLPDRFVKEPLPDGPVSGHRITQSDMDKMLDEYYKIRGWNKEGIPE